MADKTMTGGGTVAGAASLEAGPDPTTLSVVWNRLESLLDESGEKVLHATQSYVLALVRDFGLCWLDPQGEIVVAAAYIARHIFAAGHAAGKMIEPFDGDFAPATSSSATTPSGAVAGTCPTGPSSGRSSTAAKSSASSSSAATWRIPEASCPAGTAPGPTTSSPKA